MIGAANIGPGTAHSIGAASGYSSPGLVGAPRELTSLDNAIDSLSSIVSDLGCALEQLERRLHSVLLPTPPHPTGDGKSLQSVNHVQSPAVDQLQEQRARMERLICRVNDMAIRAG